MATSHDAVVADGTATQFAISFPYLDQEHVSATINGEDATFSWVDTSTVEFASAPSAGALVRIERNTPISSVLVEYTVEGAVPVEDLNQINLQLLYALQETQRDLAEAVSGGPGAEGPSTADLAADIAAIQAALTTLDARVTVEEGIRAAGDLAVAESVTEVETTVGDHTASITEAMTSVDGLAAEWKLQVDVDGAPAGSVKLTGVSEGSEGAVSELVFEVDKFKLLDPDLDAGIVPFSYEDGLIYMDDVYIRKLEAGAVVTDSLADGAISIVETAYTAEAITVAKNDAVTIQSLFVTPVDGLVRIDAAFRAYSGINIAQVAGAGYVAIAVECLRGTTVIGARQISLPIRNLTTGGQLTFDGFFNFPFLDTNPGTSLTTYSVRVTPVVNVFPEAVTVVFLNRHLAITNTKK